MAKSANAKEMKLPIPGFLLILLALTVAVYAVILAAPSKKPPMVKQQASIKAEYAPVKGDRGSIVHRWEVSISYKDATNPEDISIPEHFDTEEEREAWIDNFMPDEAEDLDVTELYSEAILIVQPEGKLYHLDQTTPYLEMTVDLPLNQPVYLFEIFTPPVKISNDDL
jgi:hypothetical protein